MTKVSKSILKPSKPTKTVRIREPDEQSVITSEAQHESKDALITQSGEQKVTAPQTKNKVQTNPSEKTHKQECKAKKQKSSTEGETQVKSILKSENSAKSSKEAEVPKREHLDTPSFNMENQDKRRSVYENVDITEVSNVVLKPENDEEEDYENDTFHLAKDSALFSQVSRSTIVSPPAVPPPKQEDNPCKVVEVKAKEIVKSTVNSPEQQVVLPQKAAHLGPQTVEIVEIVEDTETEADSSAPDTDPEDRWPSPITMRKADGSHKQRKTCLAPGEILAKRQKLASEEALRSLKQTDGVKRGNGDDLQLRKSSDDSVSPDVPARKPKPAQMTFTYTVETIQTSPPSKFEQSDDLQSSLCLEMTDKVNRVDQTTVKTFDGKISKSHLLENSKEVTLRKEFEVSKTYQIIGNFTKPDDETLHLTVPAVEDNDSFYGSDKETDDVVVFSEDEGRVDLEEDTSSSDNESHDNSNEKVGIFSEFDCY